MKPFHDNSYLVSFRATRHGFQSNLSKVGVEIRREGNRVFEEGMGIILWNDVSAVIDELITIRSEEQLCHPNRPSIPDLSGWINF